MEDSEKNYLETEARAAGRQEVADEIRLTMSKELRFFDDIPQDGELSIEITLRRVTEQYLQQKRKAENLEAALKNRDRVDQMAVDLMTTFVDGGATHAQKNGMVLLIAGFLRRYIGQRNGASEPPTFPTSDNSGYIPF